MKARLLLGCPAAVLVDVSHSVPAFDVISGAFVLWAGTREFGPGAVHLAVVDPGVGGSRRAAGTRQSWTEVITKVGQFGASDRDYSIPSHAVEEAPRGPPPRRRAAETVPVRHGREGLRPPFPVVQDALPDSGARAVPGRCSVKASWWARMR
jgi:S-adenosylmethionine hydroxide adenosyltransferase-like protein